MKEKKLKKGKRKGKKILLWIIIIALVAAGLWACNAGGGTQVNVVETVTLGTGSIEELVSVNGTVESEEVKTYFAPVSGKLATVEVTAGDVVEAGEVLLTYDMAGLEESLEQARLQYQLEDGSYQGSLADNKEAEKKLKEAEANIKILEQQIADEENYIKNLQAALEAVQTDKANSVTQQTMLLQKQLLELEKSPVENADKIAEVQMSLQNLQYQSQLIETTGDAVELQKTLEAEQERLAGYQEYLAEMKAQKQEASMGTLTDYQKDNLTITQQLNLMAYEKAKEDYDTALLGVDAAFSGVITELNVIEGMPVMEDAQLLTLASNEKVKVIFSVGTYDLARIAVGQKADIEIADREYTGTVTKIYQMANQSASGVTQLSAEIHIDNPDEYIYLGLDAKVKIHAAEVTDAMLLPIAAIYADKTGDFVYVEENGLAVRKDIVTGISSTEYIEVKEGLSATDKVIVSSMVTLEDGMPVVNATGASGEQVEP